MAARGHSGWLCAGRLRPAFGAASLRDAAPKADLRRPLQFSWRTNERVWDFEGVAARPTLNGRWGMSVLAPVVWESHEVALIDQ